MRIEWTRPGVSRAALDQALSVMLLAKPHLTAAIIADALGLRLAVIQRSMRRVRGAK